MTQSPDSAPESDLGFDVNAPYADGFNMKAIWAALFIGIIMLPGAVYLALLTGQGIGGAAPWVTIILFMEVARRSFVKLTPQEIQVVFWVASGMVAGGVVMGVAGLTLPGGVFGQLIWDQFYVQSQQAQEFGLSDLVPAWVAPQPGSEALLNRDLFHIDWLKPVVVVLIHQILFRLNWIGLGYLVFRQTADVEKLPFPMAPVGAQGILAVAESTEKKHSWRWRVFSIGSIIGAAYGMVYVVVPGVSGAVLSQPLEILPIPFIDMTSSLGDTFPGAIMGFATDLSFILTGMVLPFWVILGTAAGSILTRVIGNPLLYQGGLLEAMGRTPHWKPGMTAVPALYTSSLDFWLSVVIGLALAVALISVIGAIRAFLRTSRQPSAAANADDRKGRGDPPVWLALALWLGSTAIYVILCHYLAPEFNLLILVGFGFLLTPLLTYVSARMFGITGVGGAGAGISFPMVREASFILSGYRGANIWFAPIPYFDHGGVAQRFKVLTLTRTKFTSIIKAEFAVFVIMAVCSFVFWALIWKMQAIPSATFSYVQKFWPTFALMKSLWVDSTVSGGQAWIREALDPKLIGVSGVVGLGLFGLVSAVGLPSSFFYAMVGGVSVFPHMAVPMLLGAIIRRRVMEPKYGKQQWSKMAPLLLAGYGCGMGLVAMISIAFSLISKAIVQLPF
ncbi:MAG: peptide transporter [bacterium]|nr:peptide transporter [bacterium]